MSRKVNVAATAVSLTGAYLLYSMLVSPWITPLPVKKPLPPTDGDGQPRVVRNVELARRYLSAQPWAAQAPYQFSSKDKTFFYFKDWDQIVETGAVRFEPFALIWFKRMDDNSDEPVTMVAESAVVKFASKFSLSNPNPGRVVGGKLEGEVHISGPNGLSIDGRNFIFSESALKVWSDDDVKFAYGPGPHRGTGHGLQMELIPAGESPTSDELAINGVRSIRLRRNVHMNLLMDAEANKEPTKVNIRSDGAFNFDLDTNIATFEQNVRVRRPTTLAQQDSLDCRLLRIVFEEEPETSEPQTAASDEPEFQTISPGLEFRRLLAQGNKDSKKDVLLVSQANELTARMSELRYDSQTKVVVLLDGESVAAMRGDSELHCPEITLVHNENNKVESVWCRGAGWLKRRDRLTGETVMAARWHKQLRMYPDPKSDLDIVELQERAWASQPQQQSEIRAETIRLWLENGADLDRVGRSSETDTTQQRPKRLVAVDNVVMTSPQLHAKTKRLEAWFESMPARETAHAPRDSSDRLIGLSAPIGAFGVQINQPSVALLRVAPKPREIQPVSYRVSRSPQSMNRPTRQNSEQRAWWSRARSTQSRPTNRQTYASLQDPIPRRIQSRRAVSGPQPINERTQPKRNRFLSSSESNREPLVVVANLIRVLIGENSTDEDQDVREVWTEGDVHITQDRPDGLPPLDVKGDRLHLKNDGLADQQVHVYGKPARIRDREMDLEGKEIFLDRGGNYSWVNGAGILGLPVEKDLDGNILDQPQDLKVHWTEKMTFDGLHANFFGDVRAVLDQSDVRCQEMRIKLTDQISFTEENGNKDEQQVKIHTIRCKDDVLFKSFEYVEGNLTKIRNARFTLFTLNQQTGDTLGVGPGWVLNWNSRQGKGKRSAVAPSAVARANSAMQADDTEWEYVRIDFSGKTVGNLNEKHTTFYDQVRIVHGPVKRPLQVIDPDDLPIDAGEMSCEKLIASQQPESRTQPSYIVLQASGDAKLEGRKFFARSEFITYDDSKKLFILFSKGKQKTTIWRQEKIGGEFKGIDAQRMEFIPSRNILQILQSSGATSG